MEPSFIVTGNIIDVAAKRIFYGKVYVEGKKIASIKKLEEQPLAGAFYICPGFIDSHVHIESSMLTPAEFAKLAVVHGTTGTISDPHEIANVCGIDGVNFMIKNGTSVPFKFHFGAPSCVPATIFETAGAALNAAEVDELLSRPEIHYLSEMMNFPGVLNADEEVMLKIASAKKYNKPVDGHAPGLRGDLAKKYIDAGISTDHECFTAEEALDKLDNGMKILVREGSAAKNFEALIPLMEVHYGNMMFCSDDKHPDSLVEGHINLLCKRALDFGVDLFKVLQVACINPVLHYSMKNGLLKEGDPADFIVLRDISNLEVLQTYIDGELVAQNGESYILTQTAETINHFSCTEKTTVDFAVHADEKNKQQVPVIEALEGQLITNKLLMDATIENEMLVSNVSKDVLKIVVVNRYKDSAVAKGFIKNIGITKGAFASSVAHDSHNIVAVGVDDESICKAVNLIIGHRGGISAVDENREMLLALPIAGLMSNQDGYDVAEKYTEIDQFVKSTLKSPLAAPFMTLSFMALLVIPHLKLSDRGLFDGDSFSLI